MNRKNTEQQENDAITYPEARRDEAARILLAEDDDAMRSMLALMLMEEGYDVTECRDGMELTELLFGDEASRRLGDVDLIISDIRMPAVTGMEVLEGLSPSPESPPLILITAFGDENTVEKALRLGAASVLSKPFEMDELRSTVQDTLNPDETSDKSPGQR